MPLTVEFIKESLSVFKDFRNEKTEPKQKKAAVLVPLLVSQGEWNLLFTRRTETVQDHKGQVSFPGGGSEHQDASIEATAIREACEEVGLCKEDIHILGQLPDMNSISGFRITPVVAFVPRYPFPIVMETREVSRVFLIPLDWLADPKHWDERPRTLPDGRSENVIYYQIYDGEVVWGITAWITLTLLRAIRMKK